MRPYPPFSASVSWVAEDGGLESIFGVCNVRVRRLLDCFADDGGLGLPLRGCILRFRRVVRGSPKGGGWESFLGVYNVRLRRPSDWVADDGGLGFLLWGCIFRLRRPLNWSPKREVGILLRRGGCWHRQGPGWYPDMPMVAVWAFAFVSSVSKAFRHAHGRSACGD